MESLASLYKNHIATLQERTRDALARFKLDALLIHSGELFNVFLDDHPYPFKVNPQFKAWVPVTQVPNCWLLVDLSLIHIYYLDFASPVSGLGSKMGLDATNKWPGETQREWGRPIKKDPDVVAHIDAIWDELAIFNNGKSA